MPNFHFYLLGGDDRIIDSVDGVFPDDEAARDHALILAARCHAVEFLRGALLLGRVVADPNDHRALSQTPQAGRRSWWFKASRPPAWFANRSHDA